MRSFAWFAILRDVLEFTKSPVSPFYEVQCRRRTLFQYQTRQQHFHLDLRSTFVCRELRAAV